MSKPKVTKGTCPVCGEPERELELRDCEHYSCEFCYYSALDATGAYCTTLCDLCEPPEDETNSEVPF